MKLRNGFKKILKLLLIKIPLLFILITLLWVVLLKWVPVYFTPLMAIRSIEYRNDKDFHTYKRWRSLSEISPNMTMAVMAGEDNRFLEHNGFDWVEIKKAIKSEIRKRLLGILLHFWFCVECHTKSGQRNHREVVCTVAYSDNLL